LKVAVRAAHDRAWHVLRDLLSHYADIMLAVSDIAISIKVKAVRQQAEFDDVPLEPDV
jgi:hypothetical protein